MPSSHRDDALRWFSDYSAEEARQAFGVMIPLHRQRSRRPMFTVKSANDDEEFYAAIGRITRAEELIREAGVTRRQSSLYVTQAECDQLWRDVCAVAVDIEKIEATAVEEMRNERDLIQERLRAAEAMHETMVYVPNDLPLLPENY